MVQCKVTGGADAAAFLKQHGNADGRFADPKVITTAAVDGYHDLCRDARAEILKQFPKMPPERQTWSSLQFLAEHPVVYRLLNELRHVRRVGHDRMANSGEVRAQACDALGLPCEKMTLAVPPFVRVREGVPQGQRVPLTTARPGEAMQWAQIQVTHHGQRKSIAIPGALLLGYQQPVIEIDGSIESMLLYLVDGYRECHFTEDYPSHAKRSVTFKGLGEKVQQLGLYGIENVLHIGSYSKNAGFATDPHSFSADLLTPPRLKAYFEDGAPTAIFNISDWNAPWFSGGRVPRSMGQEPTFDVRCEGKERLLTLTFAQPHHQTLDLPAFASQGLPRIEFEGTDITSLTRIPNYLTKLALMGRTIHRIEAFVGEQYVKRITMVEYEFGNASANIYLGDNIIVSTALLAKQTDAGLMNMSGHEAMHFVAYHLGLDSDATVVAHAKTVGVQDRSHGSARHRATPFHKFINEGFYLSTGKGGHSVDNVREFVTSFLHSTVYIDRYAANIDRLHPAERAGVHSAYQDTLHMFIEVSDGAMREHLLKALTVVQGVMAVP
jgi:hypothetical protein